jgi:hypothetical protein
MNIISKIKRSSSSSSLSSSSSSSYQKNVRNLSERERERERNPEKDFYLRLCIRKPHFDTVRERKIWEQTNDEQYRGPPTARISFFGRTHITTPTTIILFASGITKEKKTQGEIRIRARTNATKSTIPPQWRHSEAPHPKANRHWRQWRQPRSNTRQKSKHFS